VSHAPTWLLISLAGGLWPFGGDAPVPDERTIGSLKSGKLEVNAEAPAVDSADQAMDQYRRFLALPTASDTMRAEAVRRLADLNLEAAIIAESAADGAGAGAARFAEAVKLYNELLTLRAAQGLRDALADADVLYQLSRAEEGAGDTDAALRTLDRLVRDYPQARHLHEAQFRRGETYFVRQDYAAAERAYGAILAAGPSADFHAQALYKHGWSLFKQGRHEESLASFLPLLELKLAGPAPPSRTLETMSRAERELLDDTLRVTSITFSYLDGPRSIPAAFAGREPPAWNWLLYRALGDLYLDKERYRDAAETYETFVALDPVNDQAPILQQAAIEAYTRGKFPSLVLDAKRTYVETYGFDAPFWVSRQPAEHAAVSAALKVHLTDLATHDHAIAQASRLPADYQRAAGWYRRFLAYFPADPESAERSFLLGELLFEARGFAEARLAYLQSAYDYGDHPRAPEAGYAALLASREHEKSLADTALGAWREQYTGQALKFAASFPAHPETGAVLTNVAEDLFKAGNLARAAEVAGLVVTLQPPASPALERVAWTVRAHAQFDLGRFVEAEQSYLRLRAYQLPPDQRADVEERVAASIYRQAESAQAAGDTDRAVADFLRVADAAPGATIRPTALLDAANLLLKAERWASATELLQRFRREFPQHEFNAQVTASLAAAFKANAQPFEAAVEYERMAGAEGSADEQRAALWQAAELYASAAQPASEARVYEQIVRRFPAPPLEALEARQKLATLAGPDWSLRQRWLQEIVGADAALGTLRNDRSRFLAANAAIELARPARDAFLAVRLAAPLDQSLKLKKARIEAALAGFSAAAAYGVGPVTTAATFETAELYFHFSRALLESERPAELSADEREEYDLLLEEQAYPFEEKAIELYAVNAGRAANGAWDEWIRASFARLRGMAPARWERNERREALAAMAGTEEPSLTLQQESRVALEKDDEARAFELLTKARVACTACGSVFNDLGVLHRERGEFAAAEDSYREAIAREPAFAAAYYNLGVLYEVYLQRPELALGNYEQYLARRVGPPEQSDLEKWMTDLRRRVSTMPKAARTEGGT
jgi:tetratricopeptide (TPR) repeat protein